MDQRKVSTESMKNKLKTKQRRKIMSVSKESNNVGNMCCATWGHHRHPEAKLSIGILFIAIGILWLGVKAGLLNFSWLHTIYFWPTLFVLIGAWMVYKGLKHLRVIKQQ